MSKAARLGAGSSFRNAQPVSARRQAIEAATAAPTDGAADPTELPLDAISLNPANPRSSLGDLTDLSNSLRDHKQKTAISIMSRFAYLEANPDREADLEPGTRYVVIDGNSRLAAAREAGLKTLRVMLDDNLGADPDSILESALVANIHRQDLDPLDEAKVLQQLLKISGSQRDLAARLHRSQGWVAQRLALLNLTPELQQKLEEGTEPVDLLRRVGNQEPEQQQTRLEELKRQKEEERRARAEAKAARKAAAPRTTPQPAGEPAGGQGDYGVITKEGTPSPEPRAEAGAEVVLPDSAGVPDPRTATDSAPQQEEEKAPASTGLARPESSGQETLLWTDGAQVMDVAVGHMDDLQFSRFAVRYLAHTRTKERLAAHLGMSTPYEHRVQIADLLAGAAELLRQPPGTL
ncbi:ParB/RepB/Spo0J family partition protein [Streptomyces hydrogenans]|uniref:ParB/RepB/Spo0J family partition protein n=1 Tax=Streptomyces hydrogenans TaxID=1873719 RepID=UPI00343442B1